jgi:hypothetical protein
VNEYGSRNAINAALPGNGDGIAERAARTVPSGLPVWLLPAEDCRRRPPSGPALGE